MDLVNVNLLENMSGSAPLHSCEIAEIDDFFGEKVRIIPITSVWDSTARIGQHKYCMQKTEKWFSHSLWRFECKFSATDERGLFNRNMQELFEKICSGVSI